MSRSIVTVSFIAALLINPGFGLLCYKCDNMKHPDICDRHSQLTVGHVNNIERCNGTCKIAAMRTVVGDMVVDVYMRDCDHKWNVAACNATANGKVCHCKDRDFCNYQLDDIPFASAVRSAESLENSTGNLRYSRTALVANIVSGIVVYILYILT